MPPPPTWSTRAPRGKSASSRASRTCRKKRATGSAIAPADQDGEPRRPTRPPRKIPEVADGPPHAAGPAVDLELPARAFEQRGQLFPQQIAGAEGRRRE